LIQSRKRSWFYSNPSYSRPRQLSFRYRRFVWTWWKVFGRAEFRSWRKGRQRVQQTSWIWRGWTRTAW